MTMLQMLEEEVNQQAKLKIELEKKRSNKQLYTAAAKLKASGNDDELTIKSFRVPSKISRDADLKRLNTVAVEVVASNESVLNADNTVNTNKLCEEVGKKFNRDVLGTGSRGSDVLITKKTVKNALKKRVKASAKGRSTSSKRSSSKSVDPTKLTWPLTLERVAGGEMTYNEATKYFSCLRKWMKDSTFSVTVQVKNMTKLHSKAMHGIRSILWPISCRQ